MTNEGEKGGERKGGREGTEVKLSTNRRTYMCLKRRDYDGNVEERG